MVHQNSGGKYDASAVQEETYALILTIHDHYNIEVTENM